MRWHGATLKLHSRWEVQGAGAGKETAAVELETVHTWPFASAVADTGPRAGDGAPTADSSHLTPGPGHQKLRCFALGSLMGMWL
jgi:hypothetical protein